MSQGCHALDSTNRWPIETGLMNSIPTQMRNLVLAWTRAHKQLCKIKSLGTYHSLRTEVKRFDMITIKHTTNFIWEAKNLIRKFAKGPHLVWTMAGLSNRDHKKILFLWQLSHWPTAGPPDNSSKSWRSMKDFYPCTNKYPWQVSNWQTSQTFSRRSTNQQFQIHKKIKANNTLSSLICKKFMPMIK